MLVGLGAHLLWRLWRDRLHFHRHSHDGVVVHFHAMPAKPSRMRALRMCIFSAHMGSAGARCWSA
jgi:hypothetical protein